MKKMQFDYYEVPETGFEVTSWCPAPEPVVPCTQVHLAIPAPGGKALIRFKSPKTLDRLIEALIDNRVHVWGEPTEADFKRARAGLIDLAPGAPGPSAPGCTCGVMIATAMTTDGSVIPHAPGCPAGKVTGLAPVK
jgi:hypothetical protein